ncbi:MAG: hypothetical protein ISF22_06160 [Methanomassiliicoccus sp.]|nr:hypothetical protein [Methanomassiliicoccus sp.]
MQKEKGISMRDVDDRLSNATFPMDRQMAEERIQGLDIDREQANRYLDNIEWPVNSRDELRDQVRRARESQSSESTRM